MEYAAPYSSSFTYWSSHKENGRSVGTPQQSVLFRKSGSVGYRIACQSAKYAAGLFCRRCQQICTCRFAHSFIVFVNVLVIRRALLSDGRPAATLFDVYRRFSQSHLMYVYRDCYVRPRPLPSSFPARYSLRR